jgi:hypothetical protein
LYPEWEELIIIDFHRSAVAAVETIGEHERQFEKWFSDLVTQVSTCSSAAVSIHLTY